jgi:Tfp pilus assembly protein PilO
VDSDRRKRLLIIVTVLCAGAWLGDTFVFTPVTNAWNERSARIAELEQNIAKSAALLDRQPALKGRWQEMKKRSLPARTTDAENLVFQEVNQWSSNSGLGITSLKPRWARIEKDKQTFEIQLEGNGDIEKVSRFVYDVETSPLPLRVEDLAITSQDETGTHLNLSLRFTGLVLEEAAS